MANAEPKYTYSVVIPHYNAPEMLQRMLNSIPQRDDIEVIVVDDGSKPENVEKLNKVSHKNLTIVLSTENHGAGYERNVGLDKANGKWLIAADTDDLFYEKAFEILDKYKDLDIDYLCYCVACLDNDTLKPTGHKLRSDNHVRAFIEKRDKETIKLLKFWNTEVWNKMISLKFIRDNNIRWEECRINVDVRFTFELALKARRIMAISDELYYFVGDNNSITRKKRSIEREFGFYLQVQKRNGFFKVLGYGHPFYRYDWMYLPYLLKKRGIKETIQFYRLRHHRWAEVVEARSAYLHLLEGVDLSKILEVE